MTTLARGAGLFSRPLAIASNPREAATLNAIRARRQHANWLRAKKRKEVQASFDLIPDLAKDLS
ncbi:hypothetical protein [Stutzerimonas chloritidismutans]|uniref:hypothetical protein n=1 Tax=Stutzerimonas chloritidismutans TaxID=203192 RepID=UPI003F16E1B0